MTVPTRHFSSNRYRYGFQGQEKDDEIKGENNSINYKYRMHDPRVGRFFTVDPMYRRYPWNSSYAFSENIVIHGVELEGLEVGWFGWSKDLPPEVANDAAMAMQINMETMHMLMDGYGFIPVAGEAADGLNAIIYAYEGDLNAAFSSISIAPIAGDATAKGFKYSLKAVGYEAKTFKTFNAARKWLGNALKLGVDSADAIRYRNKLKGALNITEKGIQAHHIIPVELIGKSKVVQEAIEKGFDFNGVVNGIGIKALKEGGEHANHPAYTKNLMKKIENWAKDNPNYTGKEAKQFLESLSGKLKKVLKEKSVNGGVKVNNLDF